MRRSLSLVSALTIGVALVGTAITSGQAAQSPDPSASRSDERAEARVRDGLVAYFYNHSIRGYQLRLLDVGSDRARTVRLPFRLESQDCCASPELRWSPDGNRLAIVTSGDRNIIWTVRTNGSRPRRITPDAGQHHSQVQWSPNGRFLVYASYSLRGAYRNWIYKARSDGRGNPQALDASGLGLGSPNWSPSGRRLVYTKQRTLEEAPTVWRMDATGSSQERIAGPRVVPGGCDNVFYSLDARYVASGEWVVFNGNLQAGRRCRHVIYRMHPDGTALSALTSPSGSNIDYQPLPAPTGGRLAFGRSPGAVAQAYVITESGRRLKAVGRGFPVGWSPTSRWVVLQRGDGSYGIVSPDGRRARTLLSTADKAYYPDWQPR